MIAWILIARFVMKLRLPDFSLRDWLELDVTPPKDDEILEEINYLVDKYHRQVVKNDASIRYLLKLSTIAKENDKKDFEAHALDQLVGMSYRKYMASRSVKSSAISKVIKQAALAFIKTTLARCHTFKDTGKGCFSEPSFIDKFLSTSALNDTQSADVTTEGESARTNDIISNGPLEARASASIGSQQSPSLTSWSGQNLDTIGVYSSDIAWSGNLPSELTTGKEDVLSNSRVKQRELSLDEVGRSGIGNMFSSSLKGKRSERDREGKSSGVSRHGTGRTGRPSMSILRVERKLKAKPKQRMAQLSSSVHNLIGKLPEQPRVSMLETGSVNSNEKDKFAFDGLDETEPPIDLSGLQLPGMDVVSDDLDVQGQDIESWLNTVEEDGLHDLDFMGLEIPMDDLSDLNMMV